MITVVLPIAVLLSIALIKRLPVIGGNIEVALLSAAALFLLTSGIYNPLTWAYAVYDGLNRFAWILCLLPVAGIYAQTQLRLGAMDGIVRILRCLLGTSRRSLIACTVISLLFAGSMLGVASAATAIVGVLVAGALDEDGMEVEKIAAIIVMAGSLGSLMPPISSSFVQSASIIGANEPETLKLGWIATFVAAVFVMIYSVLAFGHKDKDNSAELIKRERLGDVICEVWPSLIPVGVLLALVILNNGFGVDVITMVFGPVLAVLSEIPIIKGFARVIVMSLAVAAAVSFFYKRVRMNAKDIFLKGVKNVKGQMIKLACAACLLGAMYAGDQIETIEAFALSLNSTTLILGGAVCLVIPGMLTGADSVSLSTIFSFYGPALVALGLTPAAAAVAGELYLHRRTGTSACGYDYLHCMRAVERPSGKGDQSLKDHAVCLPNELVPGGNWSVYHIYKPGIAGYLYCSTYRKQGGNENGKNKIII